VKNKRGPWVLGISAILLVIPVCILIFKLFESSDDLDEQLRLARADGIPTNAAEFSALIQKAEPSVNAASHYRNFASYRIRNDESHALASDLPFDSSAANMAKAESHLTKSKKALAIADEAVKLPRCWFDRNWNEGIAVLLPEFSEMRLAAYLLALRGSVAASKGDHTAAIENARKIFVISKHAGEEPHGIGAMVRESIEGIGIRSLAYWSFANRDQQKYSVAMKKAIDEMQPPNLKRENAGELWSVLSTIELTSTKQGLKVLGIKEEDGPNVSERIVAFFKSKNSAKAAIVKSQRTYWKALGSPQTSQVGLIESAVTKQNEAMIAFPFALKVYGIIGSDSTQVSNRISNWEAKRQQFIALWRALKDKEIPNSIETSDLLSPFDGKPVNYKFDGKQITIQVSGYERIGESKGIKVPPKLKLVK
jgi:hypothetical protein